MLFVIDNKMLYIVEITNWRLNGGLVDTQTTVSLSACDRYKII